MNPLLSVSNLFHCYQDQLVLDIASLEVRQEEILAIIGPSGAGKSTLLRLVSGLEKPVRGEINLDGALVGPENSRLDIRRQIAMVFQKPAVFNASVHDNVAYGLLVRGAKKNTIDAQVDEALDFVGLLAKKRQNAKTLSGGEMQRVSMAMALITNPKLFLLDEPTANLDPTNVAICEELVLTAARRYKMTIILVTHNMFQAKRLADQTVLLLDGVIIEKGATETLFSKPKDKRTCDFIHGEMIY